MLNKINMNPRIKIILVYAVLTVAALAVYGQVHQFGFINFDDNVYVMENRHIQSGITCDEIRWSLGTQFPIWIPLVWVSLMFDYLLYGFAAGGYHVTNLILHIVSILLLFRLFHSMTKEVWKSAFVAAFFALHPLHVESVAWVAERKDVLSALFWILTLLFYVRYTQKPGVWKYAAVVLSFVLAMMSKPMVITLPVVMILLDYWPLGRLKSWTGGAFLRQLKEKALFFVLSGILVVFTIYNRDKQEVYMPALPLDLRLANAPVSLAAYFEKTFWPYDMAVFYPFPSQISHWQVIGSVLLLMAVTAFVLFRMKRLPYLFAGWMWFAMTIAPVAGIMQISLTAPYAMADRYHYLPSIGIAVMLAWGIGSLFSGKAVRRKILFPAGILFIVLLSFITWKQCGYWKNSYALFNHALRVTENNYLAHNNLGLALASRGKFNDAIYHYTLALRLKPYHLQSLNNRGLASYAVRDYRDALRDYNKVIGINPNIADTYYNRGLVYTSLGLNWKAIEDYNKSVSLNPDFANAYNNRAFVFVRLGDYGRAAADYNTVLRLNPRHADALNNRAFVYLQTGNIETGCMDAQKACAMGVCLTLEAYRKQGYCR
jgi:tetratricopeptide (TPR) repeat protein